MTAKNKTFTLSTLLKQPYGTHRYVRPGETASAHR